MKKGKMFLFNFIAFIVSLIICSSIPDFGIPIALALLIEAFMTIHMSVFVLKPLSTIIAPEDSGKTFKSMSKTRLFILIFNSFFTTPAIAFLDFFAVFIGAFIVLPMLKNKRLISSTPVTNSTATTESINSTCSKCGNSLQPNHQFCINCGEPIVKVENVPQPTQVSKVPVSPSSFDPIYKLSENMMVDAFINREIIKAGINPADKLIPEDILKRKKVFNIIFCLLLFIYISLIFFHFPIYTYIIGLVLLIIFYSVTRNYNLLKYLRKQVKARPSEKISNIVMNTKMSFVTDNSRKIFITSICLAVVLPMIIFFEPKILYEKMENGYGVRFYAFGLTNFTSATIPDTHKGEPIVSLRGNAFSNMFLLKQVTLPNSITEIRGQAFKNNISLKQVDLPDKLESLGGGAFYNCISLSSIEIPDTVTHIGGEAFYNAARLESISLPSKLEEIRGSTFENCSSLKSVIIPDTVTRIGGHAFHGCSSLAKVEFTENSKLEEIGSSAFRDCYYLRTVMLPKNTYVNQRAFKGTSAQILRFGMINPDNYINNSSIYLNLYQSQAINRYHQDSKIQNAYIALEKVNKNNGYFEFVLKYSDDNIQKTFTLNINKKYEIINDDLAVQIKDNYVFESYSDRVSFYAYYN